ncbi:hypothetical protein CYMTET_10024, partial [Cymbomonas tetramitiformis]
TASEAELESVKGKLDTMSVRLAESEAARDATQHSLRQSQGDIERLRSTYKLPELSPEAAKFGTTEVSFQVTWVNMTSGADASEGESAWVLIGKEGLFLDAVSRKSLHALKTIHKFNTVDGAFMFEVLIAKKLETHRLEAAPVVVDCIQAALQSAINAKVREMKASGKKGKGKG